jgi:hypothetical protein
MIDGRFFDKLEQLARLIREDESPFGGIQLIICGDFFQLPPVPDNLTLEQKIPIKFAFEAESWNHCIPRIICLKKIFRQREGSQSLFASLRYYLRTNIINRLDQDAEHDTHGQSQCAWIVHI